MRLILVGSDEQVRDALVGRLRGDGFEVDSASSALEFYRSLAVASYGVAIIDVNLPDENGLNIASWLAGRGGTGIIIMTPSSELADRLAIRRSGADILLLKPVDGDELVQGVRNLGRWITSGEQVRSEPVMTSDWFFDPSHWTLQPSWGDAVRLTATEMKFLQRLLRNPGKPVLRRELQTELGYHNDKVGDRNLEALVRRLRRKLEMAASGHAPIQTVHGKGYLFSGTVRRDRRAAPRSVPDATTRERELSRVTVDGN